jgi:hypothetical protein
VYFAQTSHKKQWVILKNLDLLVLCADTVPIMISGELVFRKRGAG